MVETTKSSNVRDVMGPESPVATFVGTGSGKSRVPFPRVICPGAGAHRLWVPTLQVRVHGLEYARDGTLEHVPAQAHAHDGRVSHERNCPGAGRRVCYLARRHRLYASIGAVKTRRRA